MSDPERAALEAEIARLRGELEQERRLHELIETLAGMCGSYMWRQEQATGRNECIAELDRRRRSRSWMYRQHHR